jgi:DNA-binding LacI/PurR family transcriptional regulator
MVRKQAVNDAYVKSIAKAASCDPRSVIRHLAGLPVRALTRQRIEAAIKTSARRGPT